MALGVSVRGTTALSVVRGVSTMRRSLTACCGLSLGGTASELLTGAVVGCLLAVRGIVSLAATLGISTAGRSFTAWVMGRSFSE